MHEISCLRPNSLRILTGNFLRPCRELNRAIREVSAVIRESHFRPLFGIRFLVTNPIEHLAAPFSPPRQRWKSVGTKSRKPTSSSTPAFVHVKGASGMRKSLAELVDANDRRSGVASVASRAAS